VIIGGPEFGEMEGHIRIISKALYQLRAFGLHWHDFFSKCLCKMGFTPSKAEPEVLTEITQPCIHTCDGLFICQLYSLPDLLEEMECKEDTPLTLPFASFVSLSQLIIVI
jgi:hypothetical protein